MSFPDRLDKRLPRAVSRGGGQTAGGDRKRLGASVAAAGDPAHRVERVNTKDLRRMQTLQMVSLVFSMLRR